MLFCKIARTAKSIAAEACSYSFVERVAPVS